VNDKLDDKLLNAMRNNPDNWKWIFYVNPQDPRLFVPKINPGFGWTLNFGNTYTITGLILIVAIILAAQFFL